MIASPRIGCERELAERDAAELLHLHGVGGLFVTAVAGTTFVAMLPGALSRLGLMIWLSGLLLTIAMRAFDMVTGRKNRMVGDWNGRAEIARFGRGVLATAALWAIFPLLFFHELNAVERTTMAIIVSAMAGGGATVLAASQRLATVYCAALLLPSSLMFLLTPGRENAFLGMLGMVFFVVMATASKVTHRASMSAIRLNRANQTLMVGMERERQTSERANAELSTAQAALSESLKTLEVRIKARTAALEHEIHERKRDGKELARLASRDSLTGLYNRSTLVDRLRTELRRAESTYASIAVLFLDLDKFKEVNDLKGHFWGDEVLREVSRRLTEIVPADAMSARWGGDEFVFVLSGPHAAKAATAIGEQLRRSVCQPISIGADAVRVDATIGIALFPDHGGTADELIRAADMAMYAAKGEGGGRVRIFDPALADALCERLLLEHELHGAIADGALRLAFQPIVASDGKRCESLEALVRWNHPTRGEVGPSEFIPLAERSGDIIPIGRWVLVNACVAAASWPGNPAPAVSVNVSVAHIMAGCLLDDVRAALASGGLEPRRLHLEVTESLFVSDHELIIPTLVALRAMGIRISLDDFGTGFSSLGNLRLLPIDTLKIDKSFVDHVDGESGPIIKAIRSLAHALDIELIAEGVETSYQAASLLSMGVHFLQGYYFSRPLPARDVAAWLLDTGGADNRSSSPTKCQVPAAEFTTGLAVVLSG